MRTMLTSTAKGDAMGMRESAYEVFEKAILKVAFAEYQSQEVIVEEEKLISDSDLRSLIVAASMLLESRAGERK